MSETKEEGTFQKPEPGSRTSYQYLDWRGVSRHTWEKYQTQFKVVGETPIEIGFRYRDDHHKVRFYDRKSFYQSGTVKPGVFGKDAFPAGSFTDIIITEGEIDAASAYEMVGGKVAAVSVQSSGSVLADLKADFEYINSAQRILICFDSDKAGQEAAQKVVREGLFPFEKLFKIELDPKYKDANGYLADDNGRGFRAAVSGASKFTPDGVISSYEEVAGVLSEQMERAVVTLPFRGLEEKLQGLRYGASYLFSGLEGIGKTEILRALEFHVLRETDANIGVIHLEENKSSTVNNLLTYQIGQPLRQKDVEVPQDEKLKAYQQLTKRDNRVFIYSHFGSDNPDDFLGIIRYLVAVCGCKFIFFDHINYVVSGMSPMGKGGAGVFDERRTLDYLCTRLEKLVEELHFCFCFVCHENDNGETRGSRNISQTAHVRVRLSRDIEADSVDERSKLKMSVAKNRPTSASGPAGYAYYDEAKGALVDTHVDTSTVLPPLGVGGL